MEIVWSNRDRSDPPQFRQVVHVQTNAVAFAKTESTVQQATENPHRNATWLYFYTKDGARYRIRNGNTVIITHVNEDGLTTLELVYERIDD